VDGDVDVEVNSKRAPDLDPRTDNDVDVEIKRDDSTAKPRRNIDVDVNVQPNNTPRVDVDVKRNPQERMRARDFA